MRKLVVPFLASSGSRCVPVHQSDRDAADHRVAHIPTSVSSRRLLLPHTTLSLPQLEDTMSAKPSKAKGKEKATESERSETSADTANNGEERHQSEQSRIAKGHPVDGAKVGSNTLILSEAQTWKTLDPAKYSHVLKLFDRPEISRNPGAYFAFVETWTDGSPKAQIRGPFDTKSRTESPKGIASPQAESSGTRDMSTVTTEPQGTSDRRSETKAKEPTSGPVAGTSSGAAQVGNSRARAYCYNPEQHLWMNNWCRENRSIKHRDKIMAAAFNEKFASDRTEPAMKARFQALNESGHLDGPSKTLKFYQNPENEPKKRKDNQRSHRIQANKKGIKPKAQDEDGEEDEQDSEEVMETETTKPQRSSKRDHSVIKATGSMHLDEDMDMDAPRPLKKPRRTKSTFQPKVTQARGSESPGEEEEEPYMPKNLGSMATPKSHYPMTKRSGPQLLSALAEDEHASVVSPGPTNSISPVYGGRSFTVVNPPVISSPATPSAFTDGGTALLPRPSSSGGKDSRGGSDRDDADTEMDID